ncbi:uncharacterized protein B0H64DRAFT_413624 [Chaetomium fimeti]|uniref:Uncharacterized protein n=1 Tax=Chaetomium fimeti TaxID=1854472 RepID=A0AAE0H5H3_9PEZI|nr:hypothetical protein B0H64DRAFT_413624 [Chaetomium fimeti]
MASRLFFDPVVALRAAPLVSATCTLLYARDQDFFLRIFNEPGNREKSRALLPSYWRIFFRRGVVVVVGCLAATFWSSIANLFVRRRALEATQSFWWYVAGAALAAGHLLFIPAVAPSVRAISNADKDGTDPNSALDGWLVINRFRMWTVDIAAWAACAVAVTRTLEA